MAYYLDRFGCVVKHLRYSLEKLLTRFDAFVFFDNLQKLE